MSTARRPVAISTPLSKAAAAAVPTNTSASASASNGTHAATPDLYQEVTCLHYLHIAPEFCMDLSRGVMQALGRLLFHWQPAIEGVPLLYSRVELSPAPTTTAIPLPTLYPTPVTGSSERVLTAAILGENPNLHLWVRVRWLAFCPSPGSRITGTILKQSPEQLTLLVLGLFNATIKRDQLAGTLEWTDSFEGTPGTWTMPSRASRALGLGDLLEFEVLAVHTEELGQLRIVGSLDRMQQPPQPPKKKAKRH